MQAASPAPEAPATPPVPLALSLPILPPLCQVPSPGPGAGAVPAAYHQPPDALTPGTSSSPGRRGFYDDLQYYNPAPPFVDHTEDQMLREDYNRLRARRTSATLSSSPAANISPSSLSVHRRSLGDNAQRLPSDFAPSPVPPHVNPVPPYLDYIEDEMLRNDHVRVRSSARGNSVGTFSSEQVPAAFPTNNIVPSYASSSSSTSAISPSSRHQPVASEEANDRWSRDRLTDRRRAMLASQRDDNNRPGPWTQAWSRTADEPFNAETNNDRYWDAEYSPAYIERRPLQQRTSSSSSSSSSSVRPGPVATNMGGHDRQALNRDINETVGRRLGSLRPVQMQNPSFPLEASTNTLRRREIPRGAHRAAATAATTASEGNLWGELERDNRSSYTTLPSLSSLSSSFSPSSRGRAAPSANNGDSGITTPTQESVFRAYGNSNHGQDEDDDFGDGFGDDFDDEDDDDDVVDDEDYDDENENDIGEMLNPDIMREVYNLLTARPVQPMATFSGPGMVAGEPIELIHAHAQLQQQHARVASAFERIFRQRPPRQALEDLRLSPQMDDHTIQETLMSAIKGLKHVSDGKKRRMTMGILENITWAEFGEREGMTWLNTPKISSCPMCRRDLALLAALTNMVPSKTVDEAIPYWYKV
ncbi:RING zinc finger protein [Cryptococcus deuterogattii MMRL2647]|nr:RING zinc finger protein [Cryptococcus deuterogattii MMRL2647]